MDLFVKTDVVKISWNFYAENREQDIRHSVQIEANAIRKDDLSKKGIHLDVQIEQHTQKGKYFELVTEINQYFNFDLLDLSHFRQLLGQAQRYSIDDFFEKNPNTRGLLDLPVVEIHQDEVNRLYLLLQI